MKKKLLRLFFMVSKFTFYGALVQLIFINFLFAYPSDAQKVYSVKDVEIEVEFKDSDIMEVISSIEEKTSFHFVYYISDIQALKKDKDFNLNRQKIKVYDILMELSKFYHVAFRQINNNITIKRLPGNENEKVPSLEIVLDEITVKGKVVSSDNNEGLPGVNVLIRGTSRGTVTDVNGDYTLDVPSGEAVLIFSSVGYIRQEITVGTQTVINVNMVPDVKSLEEVVIVGYGIQREQTVTGSLVSVNDKELKSAPVSNVSSALVGRVPGLIATQTTGEPGRDAPNIKIRGVSTLNSSGSDPLIIIDGIQRDFSTLNAIDVNEIDNISILKDASATAVYGVRGANGVIIVTTKRGQTGRPQVSFTTNVGFTKLTFPFEMLGSYEYALFRNEAIAMDNDPSLDELIFTDDELWKFKNNRDYTPEEVDAMELTPSQKDALKASPALYYTSHDWFKEQFGSPGPQNQYNLNLSGGSENIRYFTSVGYFSQKGNINNGGYGGGEANSTYDRYNFRSNYDIDVAKNLEVSINLSGQISSLSGVLGKDGDVTSLYSRNKELTVLLLQSSPFAGPGIVDGHLISDFVSNASPIQNKGGGGYSSTAYVLTRGVLKTRTSNLNSSVKIKHTMDYITEGLSIHGLVSYDNTYLKGRTIYHDVPTYSAIRNPENPADILYFGGRVGPTNIDDNFTSDKWRRFYLEGAINYNRSFGKHTITGLALYNAQKTFDPGLQYDVPSGLIGFVGRVVYDYDERYLAEFNMGYNGSENFPEGNRFGFFPAYSLGWILSNEDFFPENSPVSWLKIRGSYGEVGNDRIGGSRYLYLPSTWGYGGNYPTGGYYFGVSDGTSKAPYYTGAYEDKVGNPNVTWERAKKYNAGLELKMFNNKASLSADYFEENRDNILWSLGTVPDIVGADLPPANIGKVSNHGYEVQVGWEDNIGDLIYTIKGYISYAKNKIEFMDEPPYPYEWMNSTGFSLGQFKGYTSSGFYNTAAEVNNRPYSTADGNNAQAGDIRYIDIDGDGKLDVNDQVPIGFANLPEYAFNITPGISYKGFDISLLFIGTMNGSYMFDVEDSPPINPFSRGSSGAMKWQYEGHWTPEKAAHGIEPTFPRATTRNAATQNGLVSDFWLYSSNYIRLKNIEISYTFQKLNAFNWGNINSLRVYVSGYNLWTSGSKDRLVDPEQTVTTGNARGYLYPITKTYNVGLNIQF